LEAAGASLPAAGWTLDDYVALAKKLSGDNVFGTFSPPDSARQVLGSNYWYKNKGTESNFDDPAFRQNLERHKNMIDGKSAYSWTDVLSQNLKVFSEQPFLTEQAVIWFTASWEMQNLNNTVQNPHDFVTTFAPLPVPAGVKNPWNTGSVGIYPLINSKTKNPDAAWQFVRYWLTDGAKYMLKAGKVPAYPGTSEDTIVETILGPDREKLYDVEAYRKSLFDPSIRLVNDTITTASTEIQDLIDGLTDRYLIGEISLDQWVDQAKTKADAAIAAAS
jgi:multiple sugar transport system substrate-binding protein